jgi:tungstate transport system ATP-binding protein
MSTAPPALDFTDVRLRLGDRELLHGLGTDWSTEGISVLLGPNAAGKTLVLRLAKGLLAPTSGRVEWDGRPPGDLGTGIGYVPQHPVMLRRSVRANLEYALARTRNVNGARADWIARGLECAGLADRAGDSARRLSGGQQQRLAIARAWVQRPSALLLDEPCSHLDPAAAAAVERTVRAIADEGTKVILTTHDLHQARRLADEVHFLQAGHLVERAPAERFFNAPGSEPAQRFLAGELLAG